jgi:hypothetical protein
MRGLSHLVKDLGLERADMLLVSLVEGPLLDPFWPDCAYIDEELHVLGYSRLADAELLRDQ